MLLRLALRNLSRQRRRSVLTLLATAVGVAMIIMGQGLMGAFLTSIVDDVVDRRLGALVVRPRLPAGNADLMPLDPSIDVAAVVPVVAATPGVAAVAPRLRFAGLLGNGRSQTLVMVTAIDAKEEDRVCPLRHEEVVGGVGRFIAAEDSAGAVVGRDLGRGLQAKPGSTLTLQGSSPGGMQNALDVDVVGVARGASFLESKGTMTVPIALARSLLRMEGRATEVAVSVEEGADVDVVKAALVQRLPKDLEVIGWAEAVPFLHDLQVRIRFILSGISLVLFAIAVFGVVNTMLMSVWERIREIGTLLALGLRRRQIVALFLIEGGLLGVVGAVFGAFVGSVVCIVAGITGIAFAPPGAAIPLILHPAPSVAVIVAAVVVATVGAVLASAWPARRAAALDPAVALRA